MEIEDIIVKIKLANDMQKEKGLRAFAKIKIPLEFNKYGKKYISIKGFIIWGNSEYYDEIRGYCSVTPPSVDKEVGKPLRLVFIENESFKADISFWREFTKHILRAYYKKIEEPH